MKKYCKFCGKILKDDEKNYCNNCKEKFKKMNNPFNEDLEIEEDLEFSYFDRSKIFLIVSFIVLVVFIFIVFGQKEEIKKVTIKLEREHKQNVYNKKEKSIIKKEKKTKIDEKIEIEKKEAILENIDYSIKEYIKVCNYIKTHKNKDIEIIRYLNERLPYFKGTKYEKNIINMLNQTKKKLIEKKQKEIKSLNKKIKKLVKKYNFKKALKIIKKFSSSNLKIIKYIPEIRKEIENIEKCIKEEKVKIIDNLRREYILFPNQDSLFPIVINKKYIKKNTLHIKSKNKEEIFTFKNLLVYNFELKFNVNIKRGSFIIISRSKIGSKRSFNLIFCGFRFRLRRKITLIPNKWYTIHMIFSNEDLKIFINNKLSYKGDLAFASDYAPIIFKIRYFSDVIFKDIKIKIRDSDIEKLIKPKK